MGPELRVDRAYGSGNRACQLRGQAAAEEKGKPEQLLSFGRWTASEWYGTARNRIGKGNPEPIGRALVAQLGDNRFLVAGFFCRLEFRPSDASGDKHRQFLRVEEGAYANGVFKPIRIWSGDQTDWGLNFSSEPLVLRVSLVTYQGRP